jgi:hypothetical protein
VPPAGHRIGAQAQRISFGIVLRVVPAGMTIAGCSVAAQHQAVRALAARKAMPTAAFSGRSARRWRRSTPQRDAHSECVQYQVVRLCASVGQTRARPVGGSLRAPPWRIAARKASRSRVRSRLPSRSVRSGWARSAHRSRSPAGKRSGKALLTSPADRPPHHIGLGEGGGLRATRDRQMRRRGQQAGGLRGMPEG